MHSSGVFAMMGSLSDLVRSQDGIKNKRPCKKGNFLEMCRHKMASQGKTISYIPDSRRGQEKRHSGIEEPTR